MQRAYRGGAFKNLNEQWEEGEGKRPAWSPAPFQAARLQRRAPVDTERVAVRGKMSTNYSNGMALRKRQTDPLRYR